MMIPTIKLTGKLIEKTFICGTALATKPKPAVVNRSATTTGAASFMPVEKIMPVVSIRCDPISACNVMPAGGILSKVSIKAVKKKWCKSKPKNNSNIRILCKEENASSCISVPGAIRFETPKPIWYETILEAKIRPSNVSFAMNPIRRPSSISFKSSKRIDNESYDPEDDQELDRIGTTTKVIATDRRILAFRGTVVSPKNGIMNIIAEILINAIAAVMN